MKKASLLIVAVIAMLSCQNDLNEINIMDAVFPDQIGVWKKIEVPNSMVINAISGNIDDTLVVVKDQFEIQFSTNRGQNWQHAFNASIGLFTFKTFNDTIFVYTAGTSQYLNNNSKLEWMECGASPYWYSTNEGISWQVNELRKHNDELAPINFVNDAKNDVSFFVMDVHRIVDGEVTNIIDHNVIIKKVGNSYTQVDFPVDTYIENLYIDSNNRLYVCLGFPYKLYLNNGNNIPLNKRSGIIYMTDLSNL